MKIKFKKVLSLMTLAAMLVSSTAILQASAVTGDITKEYYWVNLAANGNPHDTYKLTLSENEIATFATNLDGVNGADDRYPDTNSSVAQLKVRFDGMYGTTAHLGTAFIVGEHVLATSAHCIDAYPEYIERIRDAQVYIYDEDLGQKVAYNVSQVHVPQEYLDFQSPEYDYALLTVSEDLSKYGTFSLGYIRDEVLENRGITVNVSGYPKTVSDENGNPVDANGEQLYTGRGALSVLQENRFFFTTDATEGDSGGPAYVTTSSQTGDDSPIIVNTVIGIYSGNTIVNEGDDWREKQNVATRITEPILQFYRNNPNIGY